MKSWVPIGLAFVTLASALACAPGAGVAADPAGGASPDFDGSALVARYRSLPACRMRISQEVVDGDGAQRAEGTLTFRRPGWLRIDWKGFGQELRFVKSPREHRVYFPGEQLYTELSLRQPQSLAWDSFATPARSLAALLEPGPRDRALVERAWLPALQRVGTEAVDGVEWLRFRGRGAFGARMELWVSPADQLIHRLTLRQPRDPDVRVDVRIRVDLPAKPPADADFHVEIPRHAHDTDAPDPNPGPVGPQEPENPLAALRRRVAERPGDPMAVRALVDGLLRSDYQAEALRRALELLKKDPGPASYATLTRVYLQINAPGAALDTFFAAVQRHGANAEVPLEPGEDDTALAQAAARTGRTPALAAALEEIVAGRRTGFNCRVLLAGLYLRAGDAAKAANHARAVLAFGPPDQGSPEQLEAAARVVPVRSACASRQSARWNGLGRCWWQGWRNAWSAAGPRSRALSSTARRSPRRWRANPARTR
jgi:hypothetical protein